MVTGDLIVELDRAILSLAAIGNQLPQTEARAVACEVRALCDISGKMEALLLLQKIEADRIAAMLVRISDQPIKEVA